MAKIVHKYLAGSAKVPRCKTFFSRADREPPKPCALQRYGAFFVGPAKVPQSQTFFKRVDRDLPKTMLVHGKDTAQVSSWICKSGRMKHIFRQD